MIDVAQLLKRRGDIAREVSELNQDLEALERQAAEIVEKISLRKGAAEEIDNLIEGIGTALNSVDPEPIEEK